jgi:hypothetical protein
MWLQYRYPASAPVRGPPASARLTSCLNSPAHFSLVVSALLSLKSVLPLGEVDVLLVLLLGDEVGLVLGEPSSDGPGLLVTEVEGKVCRIENGWFMVSWVISTSV